MTGVAYSEQDALPALEQAVAGHEDIAAGTYSLRRLRYFNDTEQGGPLNGGAPHAPANPAGEDDFGAEQHMLIQHLRMVSDIARQYAHRGVEAVELVKAGNLGLIHALEHFQLGKAAHFSGYAEMCVREHIEHLIAERQKCLEVAQTTPQYAAAPLRRATAGAGAPANHQGIYVIRAFIESRINELRHTRHVEFSPEFNGLYD